MINGPKSAEDEFAEFYRANFARVVGSVRSISRGAAEDVAQEAFLVAHDRWEEVSALEVPFAWVRLVATRNSRRVAERDGARPAAEARAAIAVSRHEHDLDLDDALAGLSAPSAAAVRLHHLADRPVAEVAAILGRTVGATKVLLVRSRQRLAARASGIEGSWRSEVVWTPDRIVRFLEDIGSRHHAGPIVDEDLGGRGGRWELAVGDGRYEPHRDDGYRLDHGGSRLASSRVELDPDWAPGHSTLRPQLDGNRLKLGLLGTTGPATRGVPDSVWLSLFLDASPFVYSGPCRSSM